VDAETVTRGAEERYARLRGAVEQAEARGDETAALAAVLAWVEAFPEHAAPAHKLSAVHRKRGDLKAALAALQHGLTRHPDDSALLKSASKLCALIGDLDSAVEYLLACTESETGDDRRESLLQVAHWRLGLADAAGAKQAFDDAFALGEQPDRHRFSLARIAYLQRAGSRGLALLDTEEAENGATPATEGLRQKLQSLGAERTPPPAIRLRSPATEELKAFAAARNVPMGQANAAATRLITEAGDVLIERVPESRALLVGFGGLSTMFGGMAEDMGFLVQTVRVNTLFVSDPQRLLMLGGFASIGEYWTTIGWIKDLKQAWGIDHIYTLGLSGGGFPALRYGLDLDATRILTFAAPTELTATLSQIDKRGTAILHRLWTRRPHMCVNLREEIARLGAAAPEIINYYGADMPEDAYHARNIEGLPTVSSRAVEGLASHGVIGWLKQSGIFRDILHEFLREASGAALGAPSGVQTLRASWP
jgi:tetratricopeptide (TPR) repeat protein